mmetsp:Transcript_42059/g.82278  ORF Transcript_42059/g.82278 Transcript_42059/m.82278 type:complete len:288 (-) Transcript_42059:475-1338(-)
MAGAVWVVLVQEGMEDSRATKIRFEAGDRTDVDDLCKEAKNEFTHRLAHVDASDLTVSMTREDDTKLEEDAGVPFQHEGVNHGASRQQPLYIHAPAPPQAPAGSSGNQDVAALLTLMQRREEEAQRREEEARRREVEETRRREEDNRARDKMLTAIEALRPERVSRDSQALPQNVASTTVSSFFSSWWLQSVGTGLQQAMNYKAQVTERNSLKTTAQSPSQKETMDGSGSIISSTCSSTRSSGYWHQICAQDSGNSLGSQSEAAPLLPARGGNSCTRRNGARHFLGE